MLVNLVFRNVTLVMEIATERHKQSQPLNDCIR